MFFTVFIGISGFSALPEVPAFSAFPYLLQSQLFGEWVKIAQHVGKNSPPESLFYSPR